LFVSVTDRATGGFQRTEIVIDESATTVQDFVDALNDIPNLYATLDDFGRLQMTADDGYGFDFSRRLNPKPDPSGTLGGARASIGTLTDGPFALANGDTLDLSGPGGSVSVSFSTAQFADITQASAAELAAAINADPAVGASGLRAVSQGDHVFLQSLTEGSTETVTITGGTALTALGLSAGMSASGSNSSAAVQLSGSYLGSTNDKFTLVPTGDGVIGTTPGLNIEVFDAAGLLVGTLDVGDNYQPGTPLELSNGLELSFGLGELSATNGDRLEIEALAQSDTSDVLVGMGINALYTGTNAEDIALRKDIGLDPRKLAVSMSGAISDNGALQDLLDIRDEGIAGLNGTSFGEFYGDTVGGLGFDIESATNARDVEQFLTDTLTTRREQISGVNIDEELVNMIQFQQSYSAAARYITVVNATSEEVMRLI
jgi:flagellar hook-associated protein FlgK